MNTSTALKQLYMDYKNALRAGNMRHFNIWIEDAWNIKRSLLLTIGKQIYSIDTNMKALAFHSHIGTIDIDSLITMKGDSMKC